jgi:two-component system, NtrC family, sensor histidine kinase PilS
MQKIGIQLESLPSIDEWVLSSYRRNLKVFNLYRLVIAAILLITQYSLGENGLSSSRPSITLNILLVYFTFSITSAFLSWKKRENFEISFPVQIVIDISFIVLLMHLFDQNQSGVGLLLIITIVFASLISAGRYALFYASVATIGILLEQTFNIFIGKVDSASYTNAVLLSLACFATAWLAYTLATRMQISERLASERGVDIANLARINALITQEMPNGVLVIGEQQLLKHFNHQFSDLTGISSNALSLAINQQTPLSEIAPKLSELFNQWSALDTEPKQLEATKLSLANRDLGIRFLSTSNQRKTGAVIFVEDWSQIQTQAHQVKLAALGRLTANIAHEIRNPLSAISHANQLLQEDNNDPVTERMLKIISDNVQRLDQIIKDVLELNRRDRTNQESIQLNHFITEFYYQFCAVEKIDQDNFTLELSSDTTLIFFDRRHINQILWNLCKNGWRHCQKNRRSLKLKIRTSRNQQFVDITIEDDGSGIAENIQSSLFEPFITTEKSGTGLGLYIAKELAEANGAKLNFITSNTGTQFTLNIKKV